MTTEREAFENAASAPPFEKDVSRWPEDSLKAAWPGCYHDITVDFAWHMWQAALSASQPPEAQWLPIDQAPKDGTRFLAACPTGQIRLVRWDDYGHDRYPISDNAGQIWDDAPTHYMPLPAAPTPTGEV